MSGVKFEGLVLLGHKGAAIEVPFDPSSRWSITAKPLWKGRRGHAVNGKLNGVRFESCIVPRSKRYWMLVDDELLESARASVGDTVEVALEPHSTVAEPSSRAKGGSNRKVVASRATKARPPAKARARRAGARDEKKRGR